MMGDGRWEGRVVDDVRLLVVVIDVEVLGLEHLEIEGFPLDLVAPEVLRLGGGNVEENEEKGRQNDAYDDSHQRHLGSN